MTLKQRTEKDKRNKSKPSKLSEVADKESIQLVAQEIKFARSLAGNDKKGRDKVLKTLRKWLTKKSENNYVFKEDDFNRIWKGLFYAMWMSDKPLIQEELSESISSLIDTFPEGKSQAAMLFFKCGLRSLATEWFGLDQHRMDKFLMFVRRLMRAVFRRLSRESWALEACQHFVAAIGSPDSVLAPVPPSYARNSLALLLHIVECFAEELAKVSEGEICEEPLVELLHPLARCMALSTERRLSGCIKKNIFVYLLKQSDTGLEYEQRKQAWIKMGCPEGGVDCLEKVSDDEEELEDASEDEVEHKTALDPRAGHVDTLLPSLPVPARLIADMLRPLALDKSSNTANRKRIRVLLKHFEDLASGHYPLRVKEDMMTENAAVKREIPKPSRVAKKLQEFEKKMITQSDELAIRGLSRKHRKRVLAKIQEKLSTDTREDKKTDSEEKSAEKVKPKKRRLSDPQAKSGEWKIEEFCEQKKNIEEKLKSNKRNSSSATDELPLKRSKNIIKDTPEEVKRSNKENVPKKIDGKNKITDKTKLEKKKTSKNNKVRENEKSTKTLKDKKKMRETSNKKSLIKEHKSKLQKLKSETQHKQDKEKVMAKKLVASSSKISSPAKKKFEKKTSPDKKACEQKLKLRGKNADKREDILLNGVKTQTPKKVTIVLKNNTAQGPKDYFNSVQQSPNIPFDSAKKPTKTNLKPNSAPSPINPFFKKKLKLKY